MENFELSDPEVHYYKKKLKEPDVENSTYWINWCFIGFCLVYHLFYLTRVNFMWVLCLVELPGLLMIFWNIAVLTDLGTARKFTTCMNWLLVVVLVFYFILSGFVFGVYIYILLPAT